RRTIDGLAAPREDLPRPADLALDPAARRGRGQRRDRRLGPRPGAVLLLPRRRRRTRPRGRRPRDAVALELGGAQPRGRATAAATTRRPGAVRPPPRPRPGRGGPGRRHVGALAALTGRRRDSLRRFNPRFVKGTSPMRMKVVVAALAALAAGLALAG